ncbi:hypothetical protein PSTG_04701 [Puccinia striiformis f. sp. tritici PST-78]|uniref:Uncharacterized protein n=2 Tax=Puccinia striiformis f. sp. tritici TaxID=168172 RepID=A0A0L0VSF1_9BASI|nr:hypothetical protein PSTG_04701 [Puccinia striiformis f. sp. tritici PST-78]
MSDQSAITRANSRPGNEKTLTGSKSRLDFIKHSFGILTPSPDDTSPQEGAPITTENSTLSDSLSIEAALVPPAGSTATGTTTAPKTKPKTATGTARSKRPKRATPTSLVPTASKESATPSILESNALDILGDNDPEHSDEEEEQIITLAPETDDGFAPCPSAPCDKRQEFLRKAQLADAAGQTNRANMFYRIFEGLVNASHPSFAVPSSHPDGSRPSILATLKRNADDFSDQPTGSAEKKTKGIGFDSTRTNSHTSIGFGQFFNKNIKELKAPIPLTIFSKKWKAAALIYQADRRLSGNNTNSDKNGRYSGLPYPSECDCFMVGFRYDIWVRTNAFSHHISDGDENYISNISVFRQDIANQCRADVLKFGELAFEDNPYATGGERADWDPHTGQPKRKKFDRPSYNNEFGQTQGGGGGGRGRGSRGHWGNGRRPSQDGSSGSKDSRSKAQDSGQK